MDYYAYHFIVNGRVAGTGISSELRRQRLEDQARWAQGHIQIVGGPMSEMAAMAWQETADPRPRAGPGSGARPRGPRSPSTTG